jgi:hypothetical protein
MNGTLSTVVTLPAKELEKQVHNKIRHTSCGQNIMYEKWVIVFDIKMIVKSSPAIVFLSLSNLAICHVLSCFASLLKIQIR